MGSGRARFAFDVDSDEHGAILAETGRAALMKLGEVDLGDDGSMALFYRRVVRLWPKSAVCHPPTLEQHKEFFRR